MFNYFSSLFAQKTALFVLVLFIWFSPDIFASTIQLTSGKIIENEITFRDDELIKVDSGYGIDITYYLDEIESIDGQPPALSEESVEADDPNEGIVGPVEEIDDIEINETVATLKPIVIEGSIEEAEPVAREKPAIEAKPITNIRIVEDQTRAKEPPSPFGPTIRENSSITENIPPVIKKIDEPFPEALITKDQHITEVVTEKFAINKIVGIIESFGKKQKNNFLKNKAHFQKKVLFIQKRLNQIPVKIRRDVLNVMGVVFMFFYAVFCFPLMGIAKKIKRKHTWLVWIPIAQVFYFVYIAKKSLWWSVFFLIPIANIILLLVLVVCILRELKKPYWLAIPALVPGVNIFVLWYLVIAKIEQS